METGNIRSPVCSFWRNANNQQQHIPHEMQWTGTFKNAAPGIASHCKQKAIENKSNLYAHLRDFVFINWIAFTYAPFISVLGKSCSSHFVCDLCNNRRIYYKYWRTIGFSCLSILLLLLFLLLK